MMRDEAEQIEGPWLNYLDAARYTGLSDSYLRKAVMDNRVPFRKIGARVLFSQPALDRWITRNGAMESAA